jgi:RNA polymerase sigma-70 factor (ECF subfamily)
LGGDSLRAFMSGTPDSRPARHLRALAGDQDASEPADEAAELSSATDAFAVLVQEAAAGDGQAWSTLYRRTFDGVYRHIGYLVQDPIVAEDLAQETFARALSRLSSFDGRSLFETWLHGIAVNVVRTHWRGTGRRERAHARLARHLAGEGVSGPGNPELSHARKQRALALLEVVSELPPNLREAYVLLDLRELPREEVAAQLGITAANLSVRAARARARVREELARLGWVGKEPSA